MKSKLKFIVMVIFKIKRMFISNFLIFPEIFQKPSFFLNIIIFFNFTDFEATLIIKLAYAFKINLNTYKYELRAENNNCNQIKTHKIAKK